MDFEDTPEEATFRAEARAWLEAHAKLRQADARPSMAAANDPGHIEACRTWQRTLYEGGWAGLTWPTEYGGQGRTPNEARIFAQEERRFDVTTGMFSVAVNMVGPTIIAHGTPEQQKRYLEPILRGDELWCQLYSEPSAGSDLAGLRTKAVRDGDSFVVNGQKVWNSGAHEADLGILLARTNPDVPKHAGITYFLVDMASPGIDVRPLRQITGHAHFNEVFLTDVVIPAENVLGEVDGGWGVAQTTLAAERSMIGGGGAGTGIEQLIDLARSFDRTDEPLVRQDLARAYTRMRLLEFLGLRAQTAVSQGKVPGPEVSVMKLAISDHMEKTGDLLVALEGAHGTLGGSDAPREQLAQYQFLGQWSVKLGGGTDQVQRNVIGERVLGLPREARADKDVPFRELTGG
ncbi:MAG TPA: acyl-CoA dehydrogenase family protein [Acidimicrobiales bacterium]|nr:acyl-CoA dehydrogenase family protein [Acidimicrobiales bacterium]